MLPKCPRCATLVQPDWDVCAVCGYDGSDLPDDLSAVPAPPPGPTGYQQPMPSPAPQPFAQQPFAPQPTNPAMASPPQAPSGTSGWWQSLSTGAKAGVIVGIVVVALLAVSVMAGGSSDPGTAGDSPAGGSEPDAGEGAREALLQVCAGEPATDAAAYAPGPGYHPTVGFRDEGEGFRSSGPVLGESDDEYPALGDVELVSCVADLGEPRVLQGCEYESDSGGQLVVDVFVQDIRVEVRAAASAEVVHQQDVANPLADCPTVALIQRGEDEVHRPDPDAVVAPFVSDGTRPDLPLADQLLMLCDHHPTLSHVPTAAAPGAGSKVNVYGVQDSVHFLQNELAGDRAAQAPEQAAFAVCVSERPPDGPDDCPMAAIAVVRAVDGAELEDVGTAQIYRDFGCPGAPHATLVDLVAETIAQLP